jgi:hypothetical protein
MDSRSRVLAALNHVEIANLGVQTPLTLLACTVRVVKIPLGGDASWVAWIAVAPSPAVPLGS